MRATASAVEGNRVRLSVEMDEDEVDRAVRETARRLAGQLRVPGFRPGKVPRQVLEARLGGSSVLREQAIRDALPDMYAQAVVDTEVDPIAAPDIDIVAGAENGAVSFDAVVEVRPTVSIPGYAGLVVTLPAIEVTDEDIDKQIDRMREQFGELVPVERPARDGDHVTIDLFGKRPGQDDVHVEDYLYEVGSGSDVAGLDEQLRGAVTGDILEFTAALPTADGSTIDSSVRVLVKGVKEKVLPEPSDEWAEEASEFDTLDELREDLRAQVSRMRLAQARMALNDRAIGALEDLVEDAIPESLVESELQERVHDLAHRLEDRNMTVEQFLRVSGQPEEALMAGLRAGAERSVKADLALRALADAEDLQVSDEELDGYFEGLAAQTGLKAKQVRDRIDQSGRLPAVRSEQRKAKAMAWLLDHVELVDEDGEQIDRTALQAGTGNEAGGDAPLSSDPDEEVDSVDKDEEVDIVDTDEEVDIVDTDEEVDIVDKEDAGMETAK
jgi:trigger factor